MVDNQNDLFLHFSRHESQRTVLMDKFSFSVTCHRFWSGEANYIHNQLLIHMKGALRVALLCYSIPTKCSPSITSVVCL